MIDLETAIEWNEQITDFLKSQLPPPNPDPVPVTGIWIGHSEIMALPMSGDAWESLVTAAGQDTSNPDISDQNDSTDVLVLAKALVYKRTGDGSYLPQITQAITDAMGTEAGAGILAVARNLLGYVLAADIIGLSELNPDLHTTFCNWLANVRNVVFSGAGPSLSLIQCHEQRPNNFGTHAGASRLAIALYLGDMADVVTAAHVFKGWLGDRDSYAGFNYGSLSWQSDPDNPVGINPAGATIQGRNVDGVLPDDQRRGGGFTWPPPQENYVWEALQGAVVQAELLTRIRYPAWTWQDNALLRAVTWLHQEPNYPAEGDDRWIPWLVNKAYPGATFPAITPANHGKAMGWTDWTHGS